MTTAADVRTAKLMQFVGEALDQKIFYESDLDSYVIPRTAPFEDAQDLLLGSFTKPSAWTEQRSFNQDLTKRVASGPRGTWAIVVTQCHDGRVFYSTLISDGTGKVATGGSHDHYDTPPDFGTVYRRMIGYEIYIARKSIEARRQLEKDQAAIRAYNLRAGMTFKNIEINYKNFSTAMIEKVNADTGIVTLFMTKRGSRHRYRSELNATRLVEKAGLTKQEDLLSAA